MNEDMSPLNNLKRMNEEECPYINSDKCRGDVKLVDGSYTKGIKCLSLKYKGCEEYVKRTT